MGTARTSFLISSKGSKITPVSAEEFVSDDAFTMRPLLLPLAFARLREENEETVEDEREKIEALEHGREKIETLRDERAISSENGEI